MINYLGGKAFVADIPDISVTDSSIATYSDGKISGVKEGNTTLTASLYGLTITDMPTITVHECDNHWNDGKITTEPTCTETVKATGHSYGEYKIVKEPTATKDGLKSRTCTVCEKVESVRIAKTTSDKQNTNTSDKNSNQNTNTQTSQKTKTTKKIKLNRTKLTLKKGKTFRLKVTLTPTNSRDKIIYKTSNKKIVTVSKTGKIKAKRKGKVNITVISGKKKIVCKVTVK